MDFLNEEIDPVTLPDADNINWKPVEKNYLLVLRFQWLIITLVLFIAAAILILFVPSLQQRPVVISIAAGWVLLVVLYFVLQERSFKTKAYAMREHDILYRHGWIIRATEACPFSRVQHCSVHSGPVERKYKLASLVLYTAASDSADLKISGLPETTALGIREFIMEKITANEGASH